MYKTVFLISELDDNVEQIKQDLQTFLYHLRIRAEVSVVPLVCGFDSLLLYKLHIL